MKWKMAHAEKNKKKKAKALKAAYKNDQKDAKRYKDHYQKRDQKLAALYKDPKYKKAAKKLVDEEKRRRDSIKKNGCYPCDSGAAEAAGLLGEGEGVLEELLWERLTGGKGPKRPKKGGSRCSSFVPGTKVLMANGSVRPIEKIKIGDRVLATDPETGRTEAKPVTALISSKGEKPLAAITATTDGGETASLISTDQHPFWVQYGHDRVDAGQLKPGMWLRTSSDAHAQVATITRWTARQQVHNFTVADLHT
jgi:hypothetical protein